MINQDYFINLAKEKTGDAIQTVAVAAPHDLATLESLRNAVDLGFVKVILVGDEKIITSVAKEANLNISDMKLVHAEDLADAAQKAVDQVREGHASLIMKGLLDTSVILKAVVKRENELRTGKTLSYVGILFNEDKDRYYLTSDGAMLIAPTLEQKKGIVENSVEVAHALGVECPNVAMICAKEKYYEKMPATVDATALQKMNQDGEIKDCVVSGPLMKGLLDTSVILKAVVKRENELRTGKTLSYVGILFNEDKDRYYLTSDGAMLIAPTLEQKKGIVENSVEVAHALGVECPNVAMICAKEKYYEKMPATVDATALQKMNQDGEIKDCVVSGPLQLDNAVDKHAVEVKGVKDPVAGKADILVVSAIEVGNVLLKTAKYLGGWTFGGVVVGAKIPIVVCSRSDGEAAKLVSIAVACMMAAK